MTKIARSLFPHQKEALSEAIRNLNISDRCKVIMACGTGKTLLGPAIAIELKARTIIVYLPSLALIRQCLQDWFDAPFSGGMTYLCVCSDSSVIPNSDEPVLTAGELADELHISIKAVTTNASDIYDFLTLPGFDGVRIIFSTYQSSDVVRDGCPPDFKFDLGVYDEAHRTTGKKSTFSASLSDSHTPISKRVFMTATPKHYNVRKKSHGEAAVAYSMDNESLYGTNAYTLPIRKAIELGIIANYQVLISVVDDKMIEAYVGRDGFNPESIAHALSIRDAMNKWGLKKVVTFHDTVLDAQRFAHNMEIRNELSVQTFHVNGSLRTNVRNEIMNEFAYAPSGLVTNARCLTEGVDVPEIDMVAFLHPKKSKVDIIQAIGRSLRLPSGTNKTTGYILLPLYVGEIKRGGLKAALKQSGFDTIVDVIQALREQDEVVDATLRQAAVEKGNGRVNPKLDFLSVTGPEIHLELLRRAITTECLDVLSEAWWESYGELEKYFEAHNNADAPQGTKLGNWCTNQRTHYKAGKLPAEKVSALQKLGFRFSPHDELWWENYGELKQYFLEHGNSDVLETTDIGAWARNQRTSYKANKLPIEKLEALQNVNFKFSMRDELWRTNFSELEKYFRENGNSTIPKSMIELSTWCHTQRRMHKIGKLSEDRIQSLKKLDFRFDVFDELWRGKYGELEDYFKENGHTEVRRSKNEELGSWCTLQRMEYKTGKLKADRISALESIGFRFTAKAADKTA